MLVGRLLNTVKYLVALTAFTSLVACQSGGADPSSSAAVVTAPAALTHPALPPVFDDIERRTFDFFWERANPQNGLVPDRWPSSPNFASIASVGFALTAYIEGVERGYITRAQARDRVLTTVRFFANAPQGPEPTGNTGYKGFFYHWLDMTTGARYDTGVELSTQDTALLMGGMLFAQSYFDQPDAGETEIRQLVDLIYGRIDWPWAQPRKPAISMGWNPEGGFSGFIDYHGYDEAMIVYLLALGSPTHPVEPSAWGAFTATYPNTWGTFMGQTHLSGAPLFWHQYTHVWVDFRGIQDEFMRLHGLDYFENARRATLAQRAYAIKNPGGWKDYGANVWGLTACDGPGELRAIDYAGRLSSFGSYRGNRGAGLGSFTDDGTIAPTAAASSLPYAPEIVIPAVQEMQQRFGASIYARYGFFDSFNTSFVATDAKLANGKVIPGFGWVDGDYLGIDQGPIIAMIANYRNELVWKTMRKNAYLRAGLQRAGFTGGWLN